MDRLKFNKDQRQAVHKPDQIGPALIQISGHPKLRSEKEIIIVGFIKIDYFNDVIFRFLVTAVCNCNTIFYEFIDFLVCDNRIKCASVTGQFFDREIKDFNKLSISVSS